MKSIHKPFLVATIIAMALYCVVCVAQTNGNSGKLPSATEAFNLRRKCAILGQELTEGLVIPRFLGRDGASNYNPNTNRCYVKVHTYTLDLSLPEERREDNEFLYDGQTEEQVISILSTGGRHTAYIISDQLKNKYFHGELNPPYREAESLIDKFMVDDRTP